MATNESSTAGADVLTLRGATAPIIGALAAWLVIDVIVDPGGLPSGAMLAALSCLPLFGVAVRQRNMPIAVAALLGAIGLSGLTIVRGGTPSAPLLAVMALCGAFLVGFGYALSDPNGSAAT